MSIRNQSRRQFPSFNVWEMLLLEEVLPFEVVELREKRLKGFAIGVVLAHAAHVVVGNKAATMTPKAEVRATKHIEASSSDRVIESAIRLQAAPRKLQEDGMSFFQAVHMSLDEI